jgi:hypothetical protein
MTLHARNPEGTEYDFVFRLVRAAYVETSCNSAGQVQQ